MSKSTDLVVVTPLVVAHTPRGDMYVNQGGTLPEDIDKDQLDMLVAEKQVADRKSAEAEAAKSGPFVAPIPGQPDAPDADSDEGSDDGKPSKRAPVAEWQEYAKSQGMPADEADAATKAELVEKYAG